jgi:predicted lactoylglutathione lyase
MPFDGKPATVGNGGMVSLGAANADQVKALHAKCLALGGTCEGPPGDRGGGFYAAYFRDLDGNKLGAYCMVK